MCFGLLAYVTFTGPGVLSLNRPDKYFEDWDGVSSSSSDSDVSERTDPWVLGVSAPDWDKLVNAKRSPMVRPQCYC